MTLIKISFKVIIIASSAFLLAIFIVGQIHAQEIRPLKNLNSPYDEQHAVLSPLGELFFSVGFHPENSGGATDSGDIWMSRKSGDEWLTPVRITSLSTGGNDVVVGFPDALTIIVYHSGTGKKQGLHQYNRFGNSWNYLRPLEMGNFRNNGSHFSGRLSRSGDLIIMSMNSFGSYGNEDIYVSLKKSEGVWTSPYNLGPQVNSAGQEQTPFLSDDQQTLYFSTNNQSNGKGKDIYFVQRTGDGWDQWSSPKPLAYANSRGAELSYMAFSPDKQMALFTSTQNSEGFGDFMEVAYEIFPSIQEAVTETTAETESMSRSTPDLQKETENSVLKSTTPPAVIPETEPQKTLDISTTHRQVKVLEKENREELSHLITVSNERGARKQVTTQEELNQLLRDNLWEIITVSSKGYISLHYSPEEWNNLPDNIIIMEPAKPGTSIVLQQIQFNRGTSDFADTKSIQHLDNLVLFLKENPELTIRLEGHTDNAGDPSLNKDLSLKRASKIRGYLTLNGIDFERIRISGWGGTRPLADNSTEEGRILNRRVEMVVEQ
jgi:outer membrane protein OmpA-like peptidoglycan-associated protein